MLTFYKKMRMLLCIFAMLVSSSVWAAFMKNVPQTLTQPNGVVVNAFATGDEYYNWIHDAEGYTIVKNTKTGYYVYAAKSSGRLVTTNYIVGQTNPSTVGLTPKLLDDASVISTTVKSKKTSREAYKSNKRSSGANLSVRPAVGIYNNIVIYIEFSDQNGSTRTRASSEGIFNGTGVVSVKDFYNEVSGGQLNVTSTFYPTSSNTYPVYYKDSHPRSYYLKDTPDGYEATLPNSTEREHTLLKNAVNAVASQVPSSLVIDGNNDGFVDNVTFVINGQAAGWGDLLWPHRWALFSQNAYINSKQVMDYNTCYSESMGAGVISHEMFHSFSAPDLYAYSSWTSVTATGDWDLMSSGDWATPRHMNVYYKSRYGTWTTIPEITTTGSYTLQSVATSPFSAFKIKLPNSTVNEYLVVEYRKKTGRYETAMSGDDGMLVYRVNEAGSNGGGPDQEVYIYRPNGTSTVEGNLNNATFSNTFNRTTFNDVTNPACFLSNNQAGGLLSNAGISNVVVNGNSLTFTFTKPVVVNNCTDPTWNATTAYNGNAKVSYNNIVYTANWWTQGNQPDLNSGPIGSGKPWTQTGTCGTNNRAPVVTFTAPAKNSNFNTGVNITLTADAVDPDGTISKVEFLNSADAVIFTDNAAPFEYTLSGLTAGSYIYKVKAYDNQNLASDLAFNNFTVVATSVKPVIAISSSLQGQVFYEYPSDGRKVDVTLTQQNASQAPIDRVEYTVIDLRCDGPGCATVRKFTVTTAPFNLNFDPIYTAYATKYASVNTEIDAVAFSNGVASDPKTIYVKVKPLPELTFVSPLNNANVSKNIATLPIDVTVNSSQIDIDYVVYTVYDTKTTGMSGVTTTRTFTVTAPYDLTLPVIGGNTYTKIFALAYGDGGKFSRSQQIQINYNEVPTVLITDPISTFKFNVGGSVTVKASVGDVDGTIAKVEIYSPHIPNSKVTLTAPPYEATFNNLESSGQRGATSFVVVATDNQGGVNGASIDVIENRLPVVTITSPLPVNGINPKYVVAGSITISANVTDQDGTISKVEFTKGSTTTGMVTVLSAPYTATLNDLPNPSPDGSYWFTVKAYDNNGGVSSQIVVVYRNRKPTITLTSPTQNATFTSGTAVNVTSLVTDADFTSGKVEYFNGATKLGETVLTGVLTVPTVNAILSNLAIGSYAFTAKVTDDMGISETSSVVNFTVTGGATCTDQVWNAATAYSTNNIVSLNGKRYKANWWSQGANPETHSAAYQEWTLLGNCGAARIAEASSATSLVIYPNPTSGVFTIAVNENTSAVITNSLGEVVSTLTLVEGQNEVNVSLASGIYFVKINNNVTKLIIE